LGRSNLLSGAGEFTGEKLGPGLPHRGRFSLEGELGNQRDQPGVASIVSCPVVSHGCWPLAAGHCCPGDVGAVVNTRHELIGRDLDEATPFDGG